MVNDSLSFSRKTDPSLLSKSEGADISVETLLPHLLAHLRCPDVTGDLDDLLEGEPPMSGGIMDRSIIDRVGPILAKEGIRGTNHLLLQGCRGKKGFKERTGFKDIGDGSDSSRLLERYWMNWFGLKEG